MLREVYRKMSLLRIEVAAAVDMGPKAQVATALSEMNLGITMWDASHLAREVLPELSLHFSRVQVRGGEQLHHLKYVLIREDNQVLPVSEEALDNWLSENAGVQRAEQVGSAMRTLRTMVQRLSPDVQKRAFRHLRLLEQELLPS